MTDTAPQLTVRFPTDEEAAASQDTEWCEVAVDGEPRTIRFHDYDEIYRIPGLYEKLFYDRLECASPQEVVGLVAEQLAAAGVDPGGLDALDVGAGNGLVGEELARLGARSIVGVDIIEEAAEVAERDRATVYDDYVVCDLTALEDSERARLGTPGLMTTVAALGFDDIPPEAFTAAFGAAAPDAWIAFNIKADFLDEAEDDSGFRKLIRGMVRDGTLEVLATRRYVHRLNIAGEPLEYVAVVGRKRSR